MTTPENKVRHLRAIAALVALAASAQAAPLKGKSSMADYAAASEEERAAVLTPMAEVAVKQTNGAWSAAAAHYHLRQCLDAFAKPDTEVSDLDNSRTNAATDIASVALFCLVGGKPRR